MGDRVAAEKAALGTAATVLDIPAAPVSAPVSDRPSRPRMVARRRAPGEDLIGDLFETMHDLHFLRDIAVGSDFVLTVLNEVLPCEGVLLHVFDINSGNFVVVRAKGASPRDVLLSRLSDQDPLCTVVMRGLGALSLSDVSKDARFAAPRWQLAGVTPRVALCGAVRQGGRYLGMIELVNPLGDTPFHEGEINALDYICEQFAEFLANRPIVLDADVIIGR
jgi:GAF domain-containing protein